MTLPQMDQWQKLKMVAAMLQSCTLSTYSPRSFKGWLKKCQRLHLGPLLFHDKMAQNTIRNTQLNNKQSVEVVVELSALRYERLQQLSLTIFWVCLCGQICRLHAAKAHWSGLLLRTRFWSSSSVEVKKLSHACSLFSGAKECHEENGSIFWLP